MAMRGHSRSISRCVARLLVHDPLLRSRGDDRWTDDRLRFLRSILKSRDGKAFEMQGIATATGAVHSRLRAQGQEPITVDPEPLVKAYAEFLDAEVTVPLDEAGRDYSSAGLLEHPPLVNSEAIGAIRALNARNVPVIAITNTSRREASWQEFLRSRAGLSFRDVVTLCEVGRCKPHPEIFLEASRRLGLPPGGSSTSVTDGSWTWKAHNKPVSGRRCTGDSGHRILPESIPKPPLAWPIVQTSCI